MHSPAWIASLTAHPRRLLVLDAVGALVTATAVGLAMPALPSIVGMPLQVLRALAVAGCGFAVWSLTCAAIVPRRWGWCLRVVALMNAGYCLATTACLVVFRSELQWLDWVYFPTEVALILALVVLEWIASARGR